GIGLHFEMTAERTIVLQQPAQAADVIGGVVEELRARAVQRNMKMNPPFSRGGVFHVVEPERYVQVAIALDHPILASLDYLVKINIIGERLQRLARLRRGAKPERGAHVNFADFDSRLLKALHHLIRFFKFDSQMARVIVHAEMPFEALVAWPK